jgi:long-chain acyl-CoA synthetase
MMRIHDHLEFWARSRPDLLCCRDDRRQWSYREVDERANRVGHALRALGVGGGERFSVLAKNCLEWLPIYYGAAKVGAVPVPLNYRLVPREWIHLLNDSGAKTVIAQAEYVAGIDSIRSELFRVERFVAVGGSAANGWEDFDQLVDAQPTSKPDAVTSPDHELYQMYTSGTTGLPKGAVLTHAAINVNLQQITSAMAFSPGMGVLTVMPLFHAGAAVASFAQVAVGGSAANGWEDFDQLVDA